MKIPARKPSRYTKAKKILVTYVIYIQLAPSGQSQQPDPYDEENEEFSDFENVEDGIFELIFLEIVRKIKISCKKFVSKNTRFPVPP